MLGLLPQIADQSTIDLSAVVPFLLSSAAILVLMETVRSWHRRVERIRRTRGRR